MLSNLSYQLIGRPTTIGHQQQGQFLLNTKISVNIHDQGMRKKILEIIKILNK